MDVVLKRQIEEKRVEEKREGETMVDERTFIRG